MTGTNGHPARERLQSSELDLTLPAVRRRCMDQWVDGELPVDDQRRLLEHCAAHPDTWRELALAFVADRAWHEALSTSTELPLATFAAARADTLWGAPLVPHDARSTRGWRLAALASAILLPLAFWMGTWTAHWSTGSPAAGQGDSLVDRTNVAASDAACSWARYPSCFASI